VSPVAGATIARVPCVIDHLHRDLGVAEDARRGRFTHAGVTLRLGRTPDWIDGGLPGDEEWRIEWVKLYEGLDLAHAFVVTGDPDHLDAWQDLVEAFCDQVPVGHDTSDVSARRLQNWLYAWQRFRDAPAWRGLRPGLATRLAARVDEDAGHLAAHLTPERNHRTLELYTLLLVGVALGDRDRARGALEELGRNARTDIWDDGVQRECSTDYHCIVLRSLLGAIACARAEDLPVPGDLLDRAGRACDFAMHVQLPDGTTPAISDGDVGDYRELLALGGRLLERADLTWVATAGRMGTPPAATAVTFPVSGYVVQRSGWGDRGRPYGEELVAILDAGPLGDGGHGHYDQLSVELAGRGRGLVVDPGRYTYAEDDAGWRRWFKGTAAHNTVCVDGLDQTPYRRGKPKGPRSEARILGRATVPGLDVVTAEVVSPCHDARHTRTLVFVDETFWVVHDRLRAPGPHRYEARWHLTPEASGRLGVHRDAVCVLAIAPGVRLAVPVGCGTVSAEDGWVSPAYGVRHPAPVLVVAADGAADADLVTLIAPGEGPVAVTAAVEGDHVVVAAVLDGARHTLTWDASRPGTPAWERAACS